MPRVRRPLTVIDTNVFVANFLAKSPNSFNRKVIRSWLVHRDFTLVVSRQIVEEYLRVFEDKLEFDRKAIARWRERFKDRKVTRQVASDRKIEASRDSTDNMFLAAAVTANAPFVITNDRDLLDIDPAIQHELKVQAIRPGEYLEKLK